MTRKSVQDERRQQILEALHRCLLVKPFDQTSIKDIATEAGLNHGMLHYYFKSKDDILLNYIEYIIEMYRTIFRDWLETNRNTAVSKETLLLSCFDFMYHRLTLNKDISRIFIAIWERSVYNDIVMKKLKTAYHQWVEIVSQMIEEHIQDKEEARLLSTALVAFLEGLSMFSVMFDEGDVPLTALLEKCKYLFVEKVLSSS